MSGCFDSEPKQQCSCVCHTYYKEVCDKCKNGGCFTVRAGDFHSNGGETLALCPHGYPVKFNNCEKCRNTSLPMCEHGNVMGVKYYCGLCLKERLNKLEGKCEPNDFNEIFQRLDKLEQSREANSRSNKDIFERLGKLEENYRGLYHYTSSLNDIIKLLEKYIVNDCST